MYLVFKSVNPTVQNSRVYGVEFCNGVPSFVTTENDLIYVDIGDGKLSSTQIKVNAILANIGDVTIDTKVGGTGGSVSCTLEKVIVNGAATDRKLDPADWKSTVRPAWYRVVAYADHSVI